MTRPQATLVTIAAAASLALVGTLTVAPSWPVAFALAVVLVACVVVAIAVLVSADRAAERSHADAVSARVDSATAAEVRALRAERDDVKRQLTDLARIVESHETALRAQGRMPALRVG